MPYFFISRLINGSDSDIWCLCQVGLCSADLVGAERSLYISLYHVVNKRNYIQVCIVTPLRPLWIAPHAGTYTTWGTPKISWFMCTSLSELSMATFLFGAISPHICLTSKVGHGFTLHGDARFLVQLSFVLQSV